MWKKTIWSERINESVIIQHRYPQANSMNELLNTKIYSTCCSKANGANLLKTRTSLGYNPLMYSASRIFSLVLQKSQIGQQMH